MATPHAPGSQSERNIRSRPQHSSITRRGDTYVERRESDLILAPEDIWQDRENRINANFTDEMIDTTRYFLQHGLVTTIFLMRLFALPLMYLVQTLAWPQDRAWPAAASLPLPQDIVGNDTVRRFSTVRTWGITLSSITSIITLPFRMTRDLYRICNHLQQDPEVLKQIGSGHSQISEVFELRDFKRRNIRILPGVSTHNLVGAPAPSEVYHAALSERGDLDEVLAAFDCSSGPESLISDKEDPASQETTELDQLRSLQSTPPEMIREVKQPGSPPPVKMTRLHPEGFACFESFSQINRDGLTPPSTETIAYTPKAWDQLARMDDQRHMSLPDECMGHDIKELLGDTDNLERCPTFVRRHRRSLLPRRLGTRSAVNLDSGMIQTSRETVSFSQGLAPRKGGKLQKRRPDLALANKASMTSLLRRF
jgi:hypothetical protein